MKRLALLGLAFCPAILFAQTGNYTVKGSVGKLNAPAKAYLLYKNAAGESATDSVLVKNGTFELKGSIAEPAQAYLLLDHKGIGLDALRADRQADVNTIYLESGVISVTSADSVKKAVVAGTKTNIENQKLEALLKTSTAKMAAINTEYNNASPEKKKSEDFMKDLETRYNAISDERTALMKDFIKNNPSSYVSVTSLRSVVNPASDPAEIEALIGGLSPQLQSSEAVKPYLKTIESLKKTAVGVQAIDFTQNDVDGKPVKLSDFKGKYVLIDFWASWCGPCRQENPNVVKAFNTYKDKNFTILGVSLDRPGAKEAWLKAIKDDGLTWTQVSDLKFWNNEVAVLYGIRSIPQNFLIDPQGKIIGKNLRGEELQAKLAEVLK